MGRGNTVSAAGHNGRMASVILFALAGFLLGGAYSTWKSVRPLAITLAVLGVLAAAGAVAWLL
jgi:hypothetical protein